MPDYDLSEFVSGGYLLARLTEPGKNRPRSGLLPTRFLSASQCICDFFPTSWVWCYAGPMDSEHHFIEGITHFEERLKSVEIFGISRDELPDLVRWGQFALSREFGMSHVFYTLEAARRAKEWIAVPPDELVLLGIGLHRSLRNEFLNAPENDAASGAHECVSRHAPPVGGGTPLGFELLNLEHGQLSHSWICNSLEEEFTKKLNFTLNLHGHIDSLSTALKCTRTLNNGEIQAEPVPWFPWLIIEYR